MTYKNLFYSTIGFAIIALLLIIAIQHTPKVYSNSKTWEYNDCGKVIITEKVSAYDNNRKVVVVSYYVTYQSDFYQRPETFKVTPSTYANAVDYKNKHEDICFTVVDVSKKNFEALIVFTSLITIVAVIMIFRNLYFLFLKRIV